MYAHSSDGRGQTGEENVLAVPLVLAYGATPDLALFAIAPYLYRNQEHRNQVFADPGTRKKIEKNDHGIGDLTLLGRYTVYKRDYPSGTARWALLGGIKLPTGDDGLEPLTTDSVDFHLGGVTTITWGFSRHEVDADLIYKLNTEAGGFEKGDELRYDFAYLFRVYPWALPDSGAPDFIYLVIEANGIFAQKSEIDGRSIGSTGGNTIFLSPGLQYAAKLFMIELSVQLPVVQELAGAQLEKDFVITTGIRINIP